MEQIAIFCDADDFCKAYEEYCRNRLLMDKEEVVPRTRMSLSEIMTILIMYHLSGYRNFKWYYTKHIMVYQRKDYPDLVSYNRFVEIMKFALVPLLLYTIRACFGKCSGISFIDSTPSKYVIIIVSAHIVYSVNMQKEERVLWAGSMVSSCT